MTEVIFQGSGKFALKGTRQKTKKNNHYILIVSFIYTLGPSTLFKEQLFTLCS